MPTEDRGGLDAQAEALLRQFENETHEACSQLGDPLPGDAELLAEMASRATTGVGVATATGGAPGVRPSGSGSAGWSPGTVAVECKVADGGSSECVSGTLRRNPPGRGVPIFR